MSSSAVPQSATHPNRIHPALALIGWLLLCFLPSLSATTIEVGEWYASLNKPQWNPPNWIFGPVWMTLYTLMGVSAWLVWRCGGWRVQWPSLSVFVIQLVFNALWTPLFFAYHQLGFAFAEILILWAFIVLTISLFARVRRSAALLLVPYLLWVSFAAFLNFTIWRLNV